MSATETKVHTKRLHLPSLTIKGFRGINELSISRLGRVTLLAGKNGVGKTTVLDAVRIYAARGRSSILREILENREELTEILDEDGDGRLAPNWGALFHNRDIWPDAAISIGWGKGRANNLSIENAEFGENEYERYWRILPEHLAEEELRTLKIGFQDRELTVPLFLTNGTASALPSRGLLSREREFPPATKCTSLGPGLPSNADVSKFWDSVALTDDQGRAVQALKLIYGDAVQDVAVIGDDNRYSRHGRRAVVRLKGQERPVPLKSLGDGAVRMFGVTLALANSRDGFLVIDEAENGIHHSVQRDYWKMILKTAHENNVQVVATTHSWDCVRGFAQAADVDNVEAALVRLEKDGNTVRAVEYSERNLKAAARQGIEVR